MNVLPQIDVQPKAQNDLWYKDAIIYQLHVKAFADSATATASATSPA